MTGEDAESDRIGPRSGIRIADQSERLRAPAASLAALRQFTPARIALGRAGDSLLTGDLLDFSLAHALARDAVQTPLNTEGLLAELRGAGLAALRVHSAAADRVTYLRRPDLGRTLNEASRRLLEAQERPAPIDVLFIIDDGLSALAPARYAVAVIRESQALLRGVRIGPVIVAEQARVALGDEIGEILRAGISVTLIGERPGLSSPDSLGIYLTYGPRAGRTDAERNCISNVRLDGVTPQRAAHTLHYLVEQACRLKRSGVDLKDDSGPTLPAPLPGEQRQIKAT